MPPMAVASPQVRQSEKEQIMGIKLEVSELVANCLQRLIVDEIDNQKGWLQDELDDDIAFRSSETKEGITRSSETRERIIHEMNELADDLEKQGIQKYFK